MSRSIEPINLIRKYMSTTKRFQQCMRNVKYLSLSSGSCKAEFPVTQDDLNTEGQFHTGLTTTLVDVFTGQALLSYGKGFLGVSTNIHVSYLEPAYPGDTLSIDAKVLRIEHPLAYVEVELSKKKNNTGAIVARGQQTLFITPIVSEIYNDEIDRNNKT